MAISSETRTAGPFTGNGVTTVFPFTFKVFSTDEVLVVQTDTSGVETILTLTTNYTVTLNEDQDTSPGGEVTLNTALTNLYKLTLTSTLENLQPVVITNSGGFYPDVINTALDRATILIQQLASKLSRTVRAPLSDGDNLVIELPTAAARAGKALVFDGDGNFTVSTNDFADQPYFTASEAEAAAGVIDTKLMTPLRVADAIKGYKFSRTGGTNPRSLTERINEVINVKDFGAVGTALADDTAAIQAAINYAKAQIALGITGFTIYFPAGQYLVSSTLTVDSSFIHLKGEGKKISRLVRNAAYSHTIQINSGTYLENCVVQDLGFYHDISVGNAMTGAHIVADGVTFLDISRNMFDGGAYGVILYGCVYPNIEDNWFSGHYHLGAAAYNSIAAIALQKSSISGIVQLPTIVHIRKNVIVGGDGVYSYTEYPNYQYGVIVNCCEELHIDDNTIIGMKLFNIYIEQKATNDVMLDIFINNNFLDSAGANALRIDAYAGDGSQYIGKICFNGNQCNGEGQADLNAVTGSGDAVYIDGTARAGLFTQAVLDFSACNNIIDNWYGHGFNIGGLLRGQLAGNLIRNNNAGNTKSASGINIGANVKQISVNGGVSGADNNVGNGYTLYGLTIQSGATGVYVGEDIDLSRNATGPINNLSSSTTNNIAYNTSGTIQRTGLTKNTKASIVRNVTAYDANTTFTNADGRYFVFTPTAARTYTLPTTSILKGETFEFVNTATFIVTLNASGGSTILTMSNGRTVLVALQDTPTTPAHWHIAERPPILAVVNRITSNQTGMTLGSDFKINLNGETEDRYGAFDNATNYRFTVPTGGAGLYQISGSVFLIAPNVSSTIFDAVIYKNGASYHRNRQTINFATAYQSPPFDQSMRLADGDYLEFYGAIGGVGTGAGIAADANAKISILRVGG